MAHSTLTNRKGGKTKRLLQCETVGRAGDVISPLMKQVLAGHKIYVLAQGHIQLLHVSRYGPIFSKTIASCVCVMSKDSLSIWNARSSPSNATFWTPMQPRFLSCVIVSC